MIAMKCDKKLVENDPFPNFAQPMQIDYFSITGENRQVSRDKSQLKVYSPPTSEQFAFDLNEGFDKFVPNDENRHLDSLLEWIVLKSRDQQRIVQQNDAANDNRCLPLKELLYNVDFVSWRGLLTRVASTLYQPKESWIVCVTKFCDLLFMCEFETAQKKLKISNESEYEKQMQFWGHRFEHYVTTTIDGLSCQQMQVNCNNQYYSVVRTKLADHRLLFSGETDCLDSANCQYVELKTSRLVETPKQRENFYRFKLMKWWIQSFLIGINKVVCGFRNDAGIVQKLETFAVDEIPRLCDNNNGRSAAAPYWSGAVCFNFLREFLSMVKENVARNDPRVVYKFEFNPKTQKIHVELFDSQAPATEFAFLHSWFVEEFEKRV